MSLGKAHLPHLVLPRPLHLYHHRLEVYSAQQQPAELGISDLHLRLQLYRLLLTNILAEESRKQTLEQ